MRLFFFFNLALTSFLKVVNPPPPLSQLKRKLRRFLWNVFLMKDLDVTDKDSGTTVKYTWYAESLDWGIVDTTYDYVLPTKFSSNPQPN